MLWSGLILKQNVAGLAFMSQKSLIMVYEAMKVKLKGTLLRTVTYTCRCGEILSKV